MEQPFPRAASAVATANQLSTELGDEVVILGLRDSVYYGLADVGVRIWQMVQTPRTLAEIVDALVADYDVAVEQAEGDVRRLLRDLEARGLVAISLPDSAAHGA